MIKSKISTFLFTLSLLLGALSAQAACSGCVVGVIKEDIIEPNATYSAIVSYTTWHTNEYGQTVHQVNFLTLTGSTMAYCQQQFNAVMNSPGTTAVQFCHKN